MEMNKIKQKLKAIRANPGTTLSGILTLAIQAAMILDLITPDQAGALTSLAVSFGLLAAKDGDK
jgi:hypothetical protein